MANVECVRCGNRTEIANEASEDLQPSAPVCAGCGAPLHGSANSERAALNGIFSAFEQSVHPAAGDGLPSEPSAVPEGIRAEPSAPAEGPRAQPSAAAEAFLPEPSTPSEGLPTEAASAEPPSGVSPRSDQSGFAGDVTTPETPSAIRAASAFESLGASSDRAPMSPEFAHEPSETWNRPPETWSNRAEAWAEPPETVRYLMIPSVAAFDEARAAEAVASFPDPPRSEHLGELASSSERVVESSPVAAPLPPPELEPLRASLVDSGWSNPLTAAEPFVSPGAEFAIDASERADEASAQSAESAPPSSVLDGSARVSKGPPPPPAWAFSGNDDDDESPPVRVNQDAPDNVERAEHPSFADDDAVDSHSDIAFSLVVAAPASHDKVDAAMGAPASSVPPASSRFPRLTSEAPVVSSLSAPPTSASPPPWGEPGSKRRSQVMMGLAGLAVVASFFLGRSSVSGSARSERVSAAKAEAPRPVAVAPLVAQPQPQPAPSALAPAAANVPAPVSEGVAASSLAPLPSAAPAALSTARPDPGTPLMVVNTTKGHPPVLSSTVPSGSLDLAAADDAIVDAASRASACRRPEQPQKRATVTVTFTAAGRVASANIAGIKFNGVTLRNCMGSTFLGARVPAFNGPSVTVRKTLKL